MSGSIVINKILELERLNANQFSKIIGVTATQVYDLKSGKIQKLSEEFAEKILTKFSNYSKTWLLTGEGNMLRQTSLEPQKVAGKVEGPDAAYAEQRQQGLEKINEQDKTNLTNEVEMPFNDLIATIRYLSETVNNLQKKVDQLEYQNEKLRKNREGDQSLSEVG